MTLGRIMFQVVFIKLFPPPPPMTSEKLNEWVLKIFGCVNGQNRKDMHHLASIVWPHRREYAQGSVICTAV